MKTLHWATFFCVRLRYYILWRAIEERSALDMAIIEKSPRDGCVYFILRYTGV